MTHFFDSAVVFAAAEQRYGAYINPPANKRGWQKLNSHWRVLARVILAIIALSGFTWAMVKSQRAAQVVEVAYASLSLTQTPASPHAQAQMRLPPHSNNLPEALLSLPRPSGTMGAGAQTTITTLTPSATPAMGTKANSFVSYRNSNSNGNTSRKANVLEAKPATTPAATVVAGAEDSSRVEAATVAAAVIAHVTQPTASHLPALHIVGIPIKGTVLIRQGNTIKPYSQGQELPTGEKLEDADPAAKTVRTHRREFQVATP